MLGYKPITLSAALDSYCSNACHRTMLVWLLHHQSHIVFYNLFHETESKVHQTNWFQSGKSSFYFWNQLKNFVYSNLQKFPPRNWNRTPNQVNTKIFSLTHKIAPGERFYPCWISLLWRVVRVLKRIGQSSSLHLKKCIWLGVADFLWVTS